MAWRMSPMALRSTTLRRTRSKKRGGSRTKSLYLERGTWLKTSNWDLNGFDMFWRNIKNRAWVESSNFLTLYHVLLVLVICSSNSQRTHVMLQTVTQQHVKCWCMLQSFAMKWLVLIIWHVCSILQLQQETLQACWEEVNRARQFRDCAWTPDRNAGNKIRTGHEHGIRCASEYVDGFELQNRMVSDSKRIGHHHFLSSTW